MASFVLCDLSLDTFSLSEEKYYTGKTCIYKKQKYAVYTKDINKAYRYHSFAVAERAAITIDYYENVSMLVPIRVNLPASHSRQKRDLLKLASIRKNIIENKNFEEEDR